MYNVSVSGVQQSESVIHTHTSILFLQFFSRIGLYWVLNSVPCTIQYVLSSYGYWSRGRREDKLGGWDWHIHTALYEITGISLSILFAALFPRRNSVAAKWPFLPHPFILSCHCCAFASVFLAPLPQAQARGCFLWSLLLPSNSSDFSQKPLFFYQFFSISVLWCFLCLIYTLLFQVYCKLLEYRNYF